MSNLIGRLNQGVEPSVAKVAAHSSDLPAVYNEVMQVVDDVKKAAIPKPRIRVPAGSSPAPN
jgi:hypothetical protein